MGNGCYNMVVTVLLVVGAEKTRALRDSCEECEAGESLTDGHIFRLLKSQFSEPG